MHLNCKNAISTLQMNNKIKHSGIVESVEEGCVCIRIVQSSACSACKVAAHCTASESKEKMIEVSTSEASLYHKGDSVVVTADSAVGFRASFYGYLLPLILMVIHQHDLRPKQLYISRHAHERIVDTDRTSHRKSF